MIEIKDLSFGYGKNHILKNFSACFEKGKLTSIIGTNGSGKSTLLKTIIGILAPDSGDIFVDGTSLSSLKCQDIAKRISYLAQGKNTPDMTAFQMVLHGRFPHLNYPRRYSQKDRNIAYDAINRMGITDYADKSMASLSGGMRQNVYIAMALAQQLNSFGFIILITLFFYTLAGFQDDYLKIKGKENQGLTPRSNSITFTVKIPNHIFIF